MAPDMTDHDCGWDIEVTQVLETAPRFVWPLAGPFGAAVLGIMVLLSL